MEEGFRCPCLGRLSSRVNTSEGNYFRCDKCGEQYPIINGKPSVVAIKDKIECLKEYHQGMIKVYDKQLKSL